MEEERQLKRKKQRGPNKKTLTTFELRDQLLKRHKSTTENTKQVIGKLLLDTITMKM